MKITKGKTMCSPLIATLMKGWFALTLFGVAFPPLSVSMATEFQTQWILEIKVFSGRPDPALLLTDADMIRVRTLMSKADKVPDKDPKTVYRPNRFYRGVLLKELQVAEKPIVRSVTRIRGSDILETKDQKRVWLKVNDMTLERLLVDLALERGAISKKLHEDIQKTVEKEKSGR